MLRTLKAQLKESSLFEYIRERRIHKAEMRRFEDEMEDFLRDADDSVDCEEIRRAYLRDMRKYHFSFSEWYSQYELFDKSEDEKRRYISRADAQKIYRSIIQPAWRETFHDKVKFLDKFGEHIHRKYLYVTPSTPVDDVEKMLRTSDTIVKPVAGSLGSGIFKVEPGDMDSEGKRSDIISAIYSGETLIEECIRGCEDIQAFHPQSLNTLRVVTIRPSKTDDSQIRCFGAFIRLGRGDSVIDNAHAGGIFAHIDINTGRVDSDGISTDGERFVTHPDTGKQITGFQIPKWDEIVRVCIESHKKVPNFIVGWDVVVTLDGDIEFVEGNHGPDMDVMQSTVKTGVRTELEAAAKAFKKC